MTNRTTKTSRRVGGRQNTSDAVMAQRGTGDDTLDDFPTPPWATRALLHLVLPYIEPGAVALECACNRGYMAEVLREKFGFNNVGAIDIHNYGYKRGHVADFLTYNGLGNKFDWIITNPPFKLTAEFAIRGLALTRRGVALLCRTAVIEGQDRFASLFKPYPPSCVAQFVERVPMVEGMYDPAASTATGYCWVVWDFEQPARMEFPNGLTQAPLVWIPPCRVELEQPVERINALLFAAREYRNKADAMALGVLEGDEADMRARALKRIELASRDMIALRDDPIWDVYREQFEQPNGDRLPDAMIRTLLRETT